jgi:ribose transport system substrate-binding protein
MVRSSPGSEPWVDRTRSGGPWAGRRLGRRDTFRLAAGAAASIATTVTVAGCASATATTSATARSYKRVTGRKLRIALSNSYIGNSWRIEMENQWKAALAMEPYASQVDGIVFNANNNLLDQTQDLSGLVSLGVDAICVDAASPTALNGIIEEAADRGILVISFDNTVTTPAALNCNTDQVAFGRRGAEYLASLLGGKGNIIMITGVPGTTVDALRNQGAEAVWAQHPGIKVVNRIRGMWDAGVTQQNTAAVISSLPKIDGIWGQGGTNGALNVFKAAGRPLPPTAGESENGFRKYLAGVPGYPKVRGISLAQPPYLSVVALELARQVLTGEGAPRDVTIAAPVVTSDEIKAGVTVFPDVADGFFDGFTDTNPDPVLTMCLNSALKGQPCGGQLTVKLPGASGPGRGVGG